MFLLLNIAKGWVSNWPITFFQFSWIRLPGMQGIDNTLTILEINEVVNHFAQILFQGSILLSLHFVFPQLQNPILLFNVDADIVA